jgi:sugar phosphate permease
MLPWLMWGIATLYFFFDFINQVIPAALGNQLSAAFHADASTFGFISSCYFYSYAVLQIPIGLTVDRFGSRRPLAIAALVAGSSCLLFSMATSPSMAAVTRMMVGAGAAFSFVSCLKLAANWFPANRFATMVGFTNVVGMMGAVSGEGPISALGETLGWQQTLWLIGLLGLSLSVVIFLLVRDKPVTDVQAKLTTVNSHALADLKYLLRKPDAWYTGIYAATINTSFIAFGALWGPLFIQTHFHISQVHAATTVSMLFIGAIPGSFFFGWFADRIQRFKLPMAIGAGGALVSMALLLYTPGLPLWTANVLLFSLGFFCCGNILAYANNTKVGPQDAEGTSLGFTNTWLIGGSALFQPLIGWLLERSAGEQEQQLFSSADFQYALSVIIIGLLIALVMSLLIKESYEPTENG